MITLIISLIVGGIISWAIAHQYSINSSHKNNEATAIVTIEKKTSDVWGFISNPENFEYFRHNSSLPFAYNNIKKGSSFTTVSNYGNSYKEFVIDWNPPFEFSWGTSPEEWTNKIYLTDLEDSTEIHLTRRFRVLEWWEILLDTLFLSHKKNKKVNQELTIDMILKIKKGILEN